MTSFTLTLLDATGIQGYIFSSNRLQENIGASEIVYRATTLWAFKALEDAVGKAHNIKDGESPDWNFDESKHIEEDSALMAEVIQAAGGNTVVLFREKAHSRKFVEKLTLQILKDAPGLTILAQHDDEFEFGVKETHLPVALKALREEKMKKHKLARRGSSPLLGMGVTAICDSTGLPAVTTLGGKWKGQPLGLRGEDDTSLISAEAAAKRGWRKHANERLNRILENAAEGFTFPYNLDKLGRIKGEESYVAVIHADGNRMGERVRAIGEHATDDRDFIEKLRAFSKKIDTISRSALEVVVGLVVQAVKHGDIPFVEDKDEDGEEVIRKYLPFRPLVFGGDDVTFVCSGLIGVSLAVAYIEAFEDAAKNQKVDDFHASAGISIVKMHYPFARAYSLAEELTASAKTLNRDPKPDCSAIDWHFAQSGLSGSLEMIRRKEYTLEDKVSKLNLRPLALSGSVKSWQTVKSVISTFKTDWADQHNKVVALREVLRKGNVNFVHDYLQDFDLLKKKLPEIKGMGEEIQITGWQDGVCYYFDAIELLDHYVALDQEA
jgi:hypothetical protein